MSDLEQLLYFKTEEDHLDTVKSGQKEPIISGSIALTSSPEAKDEKLLQESND
jgi:hypothetical protein